MTSVLARLGHLESRTVIQSIRRPAKRKREEWACRWCRASEVPWRGYSADHSLKGTVGDSMLQLGDEPKVSGRGDDTRDSSRSGGEHSDTASLDAPTGESDGERWSAEDWNIVDRIASQESAQAALWERFENAEDVETDGLDGIESAPDTGDDAPSEDGQGHTWDQPRDETLLDIDYVSTLPDAMARGGPDLVARCLLAASKAQDRDFIRGLTQETFAEILRLLEPRNTIDKLASAQVELSEATRRVIGIAPMDRVAFEYSALVSEITSLRRSGGLKLTLMDYTVLLRVARDLGKPDMARVMWRNMQIDGRTPDVECYNLYMAGRVFNRMHSASTRHKLRIIPFNMLARTARNRGEAFSGFRVGERGLKEQVNAIFREMLSNGVRANLDSFRLVITAAAREGDMATVKAVLGKVWNIDVEAMLAGTPEADMTPNQFPGDSPLSPTSNLLFTIAHAFAINNDIPTALRLVDFVARHYDLNITLETWEHLFEWTFVLAVPRLGVKAATDGTRTGQLPVRSVLSLWDTMTGPPYDVQPTMGMYNHLIKMLWHHDSSPLVLERMAEGHQLYEESISDAHTRWKALRKAIVRSGRGLPVAESLETLRGDFEHAELIRRRNSFWCQRWLRLLLSSLRSFMRIEISGDLAHRDIPRLLWRFRYVAPRHVWYETATGLVEFETRSQEDIDAWESARREHIRRRERWLSMVPKYIGNDWGKSWGVARPQGEVQSRTREWESNDGPHGMRARQLAVDAIEGGHGTTDPVRAEVRDGVRDALETS
ncbi:hypothetical protein LTR53_005134 [Teratosphaeriaceae sp. CCFEE 6253]|nr:hypothetical protein LTR53_005134 [Teratosphaeriaceae sp. CCFEE 6253]